LNQLVQQTFSKEDQVRITQIYWLDSGHNGHRDAWITDQSLVERLLGIQVTVGVTDYQLKSKRWLAREESEFCELLAKFKIAHKRLHLTGDRGSLRLHFRILDQLFDGKL